jgi:sirohydrochlorin cobaltochelatase
MTFFHEPPADAGGSSGSRADLVPVVGLAHGSRHPRGGDAIEALMIAVGAAAGVPAHAAFLDLAEPDLTAVAGLLAEEGHTRAVVVPLLFTEAFHARVDVPEAVAKAAEASGLDLVVAPILGTGDDVGDVLRGALEGAGVDGDTDTVLLAVGSSRVEANDAVVDLAARLSDCRRGRVRAAFGTCEPKVDQVLGELDEPVALWPLFLADGLLLDPVRERFEERGWPVVEPLGAFAAPLVLARYAAALAPTA